MLLPRFSIRWILIITALSAVMAVIIRQAFLAKSWAIACSAVMGFVVTIFLLYGGMFLLAYWLAKVTRMLNPSEKPTNPFIVEGQYPPQHIPKSTFGAGEQQ